MADFRHLADFFLTYGYKSSFAEQAVDKNGTAFRCKTNNLFTEIVEEPAINPFYNYMYSQPKAPHKNQLEHVKGVYINCDADQGEFKRPHFEAAVVIFSDPIFDNHETSDIAERIELPIMTRCFIHGLKMANEDADTTIQGNSAGSPDATILHLSLDTRSERWSSVPQHMRTKVGSVVVVRQDREPLLPLHAEALCRYCHDHVSPLLKRSMSGYGGRHPLNKEAVLSMICRATFEIFWHKFMEEKTKSAGPGIKELAVPGPYDYS